MTSARQKRNAERAKTFRSRMAIEVPRKTALNQFVRKAELKGGRVRCTSDPPSFNASPWNNIVIQKVIKVGTTNRTGLIDFTDIGHWLCQQIGIPFTGYFATIKPQFNFQLTEVKAWNLTGRTIGMTPFDYSADGASREFELDELGGWIDSGTLTNLPSIGYKWPLTSSSHVITVVLTAEKGTTGDNSGEGNKKAVKILAATDDNIIAHFHLRWRFPPTHTSGFEMDNLFTLTRDISETGRKLYAATLEHKRIASRIYKALPSKVGGAALVINENPLRDDEVGPSDDKTEDADPSDAVPPDKVRADVLATYDTEKRLQSNVARLLNDTASSTSFEVVDGEDLHAEVTRLRSILAQHGLCD